MAIANRFNTPGNNDQIARYFQLQYVYVKEFLTKELIELLSPEDQLFVDLFRKVALHSHRQELCEWWKRIHAGHATVDEARKSIPRLDLKLAAIKRKHQSNPRDKDNKEIVK